MISRKKLKLSWMDVEDKVQVSELTRQVKQLKSEIQPKLADKLKSETYVNYLLTSSNLKTTVNWLTSSNLKEKQVLQLLLKTYRQSEIYLRQIIGFYEGRGVAVDGRCTGSMYRQEQNGVTCDLVIFLKPCKDCVYLSHFMTEQDSNPRLFVSKA